MIPSLVPPEIVELHRALLSALRVDYFPPGMAEMNNWRDFLFVMAPLGESEGGAFTKSDLAPVIRLMREDNKCGSANWSLRFAKIMREPESFRDMVLIARKKLRPRPPVEHASRTDATGANVAIERDPSAENEPRPIKDDLKNWREKMKGPRQ